MEYVRISQYFLTFGMGIGLVAACQPSLDADDGGTRPGKSGSPTADGDGDGDGDGDAPPKFDVGASGDLAPGGEGCENVDILFVIDNSGSMRDEQSHLIAAFDGFSEQIQTQLVDERS